MKKRFIYSLCWIFTLAIVVCTPLVVTTDAHAKTPSTQGTAPPAELPYITDVVTATDGFQISPSLYGINYDWNLVPSSEFSAWVNAITSMGINIVRYPSGWNAEHYIWGENQEVAWQTSDGNGYNPKKQSPGADPATLLANVPSVDFVLPSALYDQHPSADNLAEIVGTSTQLVSEYGTKVSIWEVGNEWWNQGGNGALLPEYATLVAHVVPAIKAVNPAVKVYATVQYEPRPGAPYTSLAQEVTQMRTDIIADGGQAAWNDIDGISIHGYCTDPSSQEATTTWPDCTILPSVASTIRQAAQDPNIPIFDSEWNAGPRKTMPFIENAYGTIFAFQDMAYGNISAATYWPGSDFVQANSLVGSYKNNFPLTPTGMLVSWLSKYYEGTTLQLSGGLPGIAAEAENGTITVFIPTQNNGPQAIRLSMGNGISIKSIDSAEVLYTDNPNGSGPAISKAQTATLPVQLGQPDSSTHAYIDFTLNPGTPGRGSSWEIARITFTPSASVTPILTKTSGANTNWLAKLWANLTASVINAF